MDVLQVLTLAAIASTKDKSNIDPSDFFGIAEDVKALVENSNLGIKDLLRKYAGVTWDGKQPLRECLIEHGKLHSQADYALAQLAVDERRFAGACEIVAYDRAIPGKINPQRVKDAQVLIAGWNRKQDELARKPGEDADAHVQEPEECTN